MFVLCPRSHGLLPCWSAAHYLELVAQANRASRRALQAQEVEVQFVRQTHTALEQAQPQRAQQLEEEAKKARPFCCCYWALRMAMAAGAAAAAAAASYTCL